MAKTEKAPEVVDSKLVPFPELAKSLEPWEKEALRAYGNFPANQELSQEKFEQLLAELRGTPAVKG